MRAHPSAVLSLPFGAPWRPLWVRVRDAASCGSQKLSPPPPPRPAQHPAASDPASAPGRRPRARPRWPVPALHLAGQRQAPPPSEVTAAPAGTCSPRPTTLPRPPYPGSSLPGVRVQDPPRVGVRGESHHLPGAVRGPSQAAGGGWRAGAGRADLAEGAGSWPRPRPPAQLSIYRSGQMYPHFGPPNPTHRGTPGPACPLSAGLPGGFFLPEQPQRSRAAPSPGQSLLAPPPARPLPLPASRPPLPASHQGRSLAGSLGRQSRLRAPKPHRHPRVLGW